MSTSEETDFSEKKYVRLIMFYWLVGIGIGIILVHLNDANTIAREQRDATYEQTDVLAAISSELSNIRCEVEKIEQIVSGDVPPSTPPLTTGSPDPGKDYTSTTVPTNTVQTNPDNPNEQVPPPDGRPVTGCIASPSVAPG